MYALRNALSCGYQVRGQISLADLLQLNTDIADTLPTPRESASHTSERQKCPSGLGLMSSTQETAMTGVGDNDTSVAKSADAGVPGSW